jgi:hypothetical protein
MSDQKQAEGADDPAAEVARVVRRVEAMSDEVVDALTERLRLIPTLPRNASAVDLLADLLALQFHGVGIEGEDAFTLLLLIGDSAWYARMQPPVPPLVEQRLQSWARLFGPWINELFRLNDWPDDWRRFTVEHTTVRTPVGEEHRIRVSIFKVRDAEATYEMSPDSYVELINGLLEEVPKLAEQARTAVSREAWSDLQERMASVAPIAPERLADVTVDDA